MRYENPSSTTVKEIRAAIRSFNLAAYAPPSSIRLGKLQMHRIMADDAFCKLPSAVFGIPIDWVADENTVEVVE